MVDSFGRLGFGGLVDLDWGRGKMVPLRVFANYLKNGSTDFHQTCVTFKASFEIKRLKIGHSLLPW